MEPSCISAEVYISEDTKSLLEKRMEMINICRLSLVRKRQHLLGEIVSRPGLVSTAAEPIKCIFGFNLDGDGCPGNAVYSCEDCGAFCCDLHKTHSTHQTTTDGNPNILLRQQIAASATIRSSNASGSDARRPISTDTSGAPKKAPARNSRADLNQRYLTITGRQTLDSKHRTLKVAEFKAIVEALENGSSQDVSTTVVPRVPATAPSSSAQSTAATIPPLSVSLPGGDSLLTSLMLTLIQSNPMLKDQLNALVNQVASSLPAGNNSTSVNVGVTSLEEEDSNDDDSIS